MKEHPLSSHCLPGVAASQTQLVFFQQWETGMPETYTAGEIVTFQWNVIRCIVGVLLASSPGFPLLGMKKLKKEGSLVKFESRV